MAALGIPTEGAHYFHLAAQRPFCSDPIVVDAAAVWREVLRHKNVVWQTDAGIGSTVDA